VLPPLYLTKFFKAVCDLTVRGDRQEVGKEGVGFTEFIPKYDFGQVKIN